MTKGNFIISLDFELHWGVADLWRIEDRIDYFTATRKSIPHVLALFKQFGIHATWATVGFLFAKNKEQLLEFCPTLRPTYHDKILSYYNLIDNNEVGSDENEDPFHYAPSLIQKIIETPGQELATHTFAHYYCNEIGQTLEQFEADIKAAQAISNENFGIELKSLVFPRNQFNSDYLGVANRNGIKVVRSNPDVWFWKSNSKFIPIARAFDTLLPISGSLTYKTPKVQLGEVLNLPASRFLRPYTEKEKAIQGIKVSRIKSEMTHAAKRGNSYHLWWHPHNFGYSMEKNHEMLIEVLRHYYDLNQQYGFESKSMIEMY
ncbi:MAG TPA: polysaccharide deacetylase family protein [Flavobacterium sp.]|jgi:peptidoglycan/xylan/chitin deacetylase (PgdA/CDA1 family)